LKSLLAVVDSRLLLGTGSNSPYRTARSDAYNSWLRPTGLWKEFGAYCANISKNSGEGDAVWVIL